jgi:hypothetical protein
MFGGKTYPDIQSRESLLQSVAEEIDEDFMPTAGAKRRQAIVKGRGKEASSFGANTAVYRVKLANVLLQRMCSRSNC